MFVRYYVIAMALSRSEAVAVRNAQFVALYEEVHQPAWRLALYLCGRREDAEDLLAETVANAIRKFDRLRDHTKFRSWLLKTMRNLHIDHMRRRQRQLAPRCIRHIEKRRRYFRANCSAAKCRGPRA